MGDKYFRSRIKELMTTSKLTTEELSKKSGIDILSINQFCRGSRVPSEKETKALAKAFDVDYDYMMGFDKKKEKETKKTPDDPKSIQKLTIRLKALMDEKGVDRQSLSEATSLSYSGICSILRGERMPSYNFLKVLGDFFDVDVEYLTGQSKIRRQNLKQETAQISMAMRLKNLLRERNLKKQDLARRTGLSYSAVCQYASGDRGPSRNTQQLLANFFDVDVDYLMGRSDIRRSEDLKKVIDDKLSMFDMRLINAFKEANPRDKEVVKMILHID